MKRATGGATLHCSREFVMPAVVLDRESPEPLHAQLYRTIAAAIRAGEFEPETRLPSTRWMAKLLGVSRNTVLSAYEALSADELLRAERGCGMRVKGSASAGVGAFRLKPLLREAHYPARTVSLTDPDGNSLYISY